MNKNSFTKKDIGAAVIFKGFDGGSYSATISNVQPGPGGCVQVRYFPVSKEPAYASLPRSEWHRLTRFGAASFLTIA